MKLRVSGKSMYPTLVDGDMLTVEKQGEYQEGDILVVNNRDGLMVHRAIMKKNFNGKVFYLTKGDNNPFIDRWQLQEKIVGKVVGVNEDC